MSEKTNEKTTHSTTGLGPWLAVAWALTACAPQPTQSPEDPAAAALQARHERLSKSRVSAAGLFEQPIDWSAAREAAAPEATPAQLAALVDAVPMPVLLPSDPDLLASAKITKGEGWYGASMKADGVHVALHGRSSAIRRPALRAELGSEGLGQGPRVSRAHMITSVSFERFGVSYILDVECARPSQDARCSDGAFALSLQKSLAVAGGRP